MSQKNLNHHEKTEQTRIGKLEDYYSTQLNSSEKQNTVLREEVNNMRNNFKSKEEYE